MTDRLLPVCLWHFLYIDQEVCPLHLNFCPHDLNADTPSLHRSAISSQRPPKLSDQRGTRREYYTVITRKRYTYLHHPTAGTVRLLCQPSRHPGSNCPPRRRTISVVKGVVTQHLVTNDSNSPRPPTMPVNAHAALSKRSCEPVMIVRRHKPRLLSLA